MNSLIENASAFANVVVCPNCRTSFTKKRRDQLYCAAKCRKDASQKLRRQDQPQNSSSSPTKRRTNLEFFDKAKRMAEQLYTLPPNERLGFVMDLIAEARSGNAALRHILTNRTLLYPDKSNTKLFYRNCPESYFTISQAADRYCKWFWNAGVREVVLGRASEPDTGEIAETKASSPCISIGLEGFAERGFQRLAC